jgi:hypothetical protein
MPRDEDVVGGTQGDLTQQLIDTDIWTDEMLAAAGIPVLDSPVVSVGSGIGSFVFADYLRIAGVPASSIRVVGRNEVPWSTYEYLTRVSQIPRGERLRSDSGSRPDCIWGWPSYALREAWKEKTLAPVWNVMTEPFLTDYYTPKAGDAFESMEKEAARIDYFSMLHLGLVRMVRRRHGGGYFTIFTPDENTTGTKRVAYRSTYVHMAIGYPGLKFLPDLQDYRKETGDYTRVVNAYEPHEHVYDELKRRPGSTVLIRGGGIVASRILQRLIDDRDAFATNVQIDHLFRTYYTGTHGSGLTSRRQGKDGWAFQGFNWPKSTWGGQMLAQTQKAEGDARKAIYEKHGGTNTPHRKLWKKQLSRGRTQGWYRSYQGVVDGVEQTGDNRVVSHIHDDAGRSYDLVASFIIDCTGLEADIREHRVLADLMDHSGAGRNPLGKLDVERTFEVRGTASGAGRLYAVGSSTLGGYFPGVDTFLGLQYAAQRIHLDLADQRFIKKIGPLRSTSQWLKWVTGAKP